MKKSEELKKKRHSATYSIENLVVSLSFNRDISLKTVANKYIDAKFNLNKFPGICIRLKTPKCAILLFSNKKCVITGLKFSKHIPIVIDIIIKKLKRIGIEIKEEPDWKLVNIVISLNLKQRISLDEATLLLNHSIYEPEVFPGLIFRIYKPITGVFLIFNSGKVVLTGLKNEKDIVPAIKILGTTLKENQLLK